MAEGNNSRVCKWCGTSALKAAYRADDAPNGAGSVFAAGWYIGCSGESNCPDTTGIFPTMEQAWACVDEGRDAEASVATAAGQPDAQSDGETIDEVRLARALVARWRSAYSGLGVTRTAPGMPGYSREADEAMGSLLAMTDDYMRLAAGGSASKALVEFEQGRMQSTGLDLVHKRGTGWTATVRFSNYGDERCGVSGGVSTIYFGALGEVISLCVEAALRMGVAFKDPTLYVPGDGEGADTGLPRNWRHLVREQSTRLGWRFLYELEGTTA